jgi:hypothetical protein
MYIVTAIYIYNDIDSKKTSDPTMPRMVVHCYQCVTCRDTITTIGINEGYLREKKNMFTVQMCSANAVEKEPVFIVQSCSIFDHSIPT